MHGLASISNVKNLGSYDPTSPWYAADSLKLNGVLPSMIYDFASNRFYDSANGVSSVDALFGSVRTSNATMYDDNGNIAFAPANMILYSDDYSNAVWTKTDTTMSQDGTLAPSGDQAWLATEGTAGTALVTQNVGGGSLPTGALYAMTFEVKYGNCRWLRLAVGGGPGSLNTWFDVQNGVMGSSIPVGSGFVQAPPIFTALPNGWYRVTVFVGGIGSSTVFQATLGAPSDGVTSRVNNSTRYLGRSQFEYWYQSAPALPLRQTTSAAYYSARLDTEPLTLTKRGIRIESASTNLVVNSESSGSAYSGIAATISAAPSNILGRPTVRMTADGTSAAHYMFAAAYTPAASTLHVTSVYLRMVDNRYVQFTQSSNYNGTGAYANFDLQDGVVTDQGNGGTGYIKSVGNGVYRCIFTSSTGGAPTAGSPVIIGAIPAGNSVRLASSTLTSSYDIMGFQYETAPLSTYIPTFGAAATRAADIVISSSVGWFDQTKGTWLSVFETETPNSSLTRRLFSISDGSASNYLSTTLSGSQTGGAVSYVAGVGSGLPATPNTLTNNARNKIVSLFNTPTKKVTMNGGATQTASIAFLTSGYNRLDVGRNPGSNTLDGWLRTLVYYPDASASDAQLEALST